MASQIKSPGRCLCPISASCPSPPSLLWNGDNHMQLYIQHIKAASTIDITASCTKLDQLAHTATKPICVYTVPSEHQETSGGIIFMCYQGDEILLARYTQHNWSSPLAGSGRHSLASRARHNTLYWRCPAPGPNKIRSLLVQLCLMVHSFAFTV